MESHLLRKALCGLSMFKKFNLRMLYITGYVKFVNDKKGSILKTDFSL